MFVDMEKAFDRVAREELEYCESVRMSGVAKRYEKIMPDVKH